MKKLLIIITTLTSLSLSAKENVDVIYYNAKVYTLNRNFDIQSAMAIKNGKIVSTGTDQQIQTAYTATKTINLQKKIIYPGFIDAHCHFTGYALDQYKADLTATNSYKAVLKKLAIYESTNKLPWIYGRGWDQNDWSIKAFPDKKELDSLFPGKPLILKRIDGHAILCNSKALKMAGITVNTKIDGGVIEIKNGEPTGILIDNAMQLAEKIIPVLPENMSITYLSQMQQQCFSYGLTYVVDCGLEKYPLQLLQQQYKKGNLQIGMTALLSGSDKATLNDYLQKGPLHRGQLHISGIKIYADGALGSRGACLLQPYSDDSHNHGMMLTRKEDIIWIENQAVKYGWQVCTHAIGDSANRTVLQLYAQVLKDKNDLRWRIEHAQVIHPEDFPYFSKYSIVPSVQPTHAISDMPWVAERLGNERLNEAYAYKALLQQNGWIALGTDFPVEGINPIATFYTAVFRTDKNGNPPDGFLPANAISRKEALYGMTIWAAKSVFREQEKGSLEPGKDADMVIMDCDLMQDEPQKILVAKPSATLLRGKIVYGSVQ